MASHGDTHAFCAHPACHQCKPNWREQPCPPAFGHEYAGIDADPAAQSQIVNVEVIGDVRSAFRRRELDLVLIWRLDR
jgi:hypothetical protein